MLLLLVLLLPATAFAYDFEVDGIYYNINGNDVAVTYSGSSLSIYSGAVIIPATVTYNGTTYPVTSIGEMAFYNCSGLTSIVIPNSVTEIGIAALFGCSGLTSIDIPNSVTSIGIYALRECISLTSIVVPNSVTSIGELAFGYCPGLTSIVVESNNPRYDSRSNCNAIIETSSNTLIAACKSTIIPNSVTSIGAWSFTGSTGLTSIVIPNSVTVIGDDAFYGCTGLTSIDIPNSVTEIGGWAFGNCPGLTSIVIPNSVTEIGSMVFMNCPGLTGMVVESNNPRYDSRSNCNAIIETSTNTLIAGCKSTIIPNSVTAIGDNALYWCDGLTSIVIPNSVTSIGEMAFYHCTGLTDVYCYIADLSRVSSGNNQFLLEDGDYSGRTLHVLQGMADAYRADVNWYPYFGQIVDDLKPDVPGDVNGDLEVNIADVNAVTDIILGGSGDPSAADVNGDGEINIADINALINIILGATGRTCL